MVILGTEYAGEMKKGVFTIMNYLMPKRGVLSMHCSANEGPGGRRVAVLRPVGHRQDDALGRSAAAADRRRRALLERRRHLQHRRGLLRQVHRPLGARRSRRSIDAIRFGTVLENVVFDAETRAGRITTTRRITENTRAAIRSSSSPTPRFPCIGGHPRNIIFLTCDAFGVLPPVSRLTPAQAMYHFISGYTAKVAGTEMGVTEPQATFSACFGAAFLVWHPTKYAEMLAERRCEEHKAAGLAGEHRLDGRAPTASASRIKLAHTRAIIDAIHAGALTDASRGSGASFRTCPCPSRCPAFRNRSCCPNKPGPTNTRIRRPQETGRFVPGEFQQVRRPGEPKNSPPAGPRV